MSKNLEPGWPGSADGKVADRTGDQWTLVLVRELDHAPEVVWGALTEPEQLRAWAPFEADNSLARSGAQVTLTSLGPSPQAAETKVERAEPFRVLEYRWGPNPLRWELEATTRGTKLTLWATIDHRYIAMGAAGWHLCLAVLERRLAGGAPARVAGPEAFQHPEWQRLHQEYIRRFGGNAIA